jgi:hypothetical protein
MPHRIAQERKGRGQENTSSFSRTLTSIKICLGNPTHFLQIQVGAISSFITSRNRYASGDLALPLGLWLFACQAHTDIKRILCRFGYSVSDSTARHALNTLTESSLNDLQAKVRDATDRGEVEWGKVSDNVQRYDKRYTSMVWGCRTNSSTGRRALHFVSTIASLVHSMQMIT